MTGAPDSPHLVARRRPGSRSATLAAAVAATSLLAALPATTAAQERLGEVGEWRVGPTIQRWSFGTALQQDSLQIEGATQITLPIAVSAPLGSRVRLDVSGAYALGSVQLAAPVGAQRRNELRLDGPTDVRLRMTGRLAGDNVLLTLGVNAPSGRTDLNAEQLGALRVLGAPALRFPAPVLGVGPGITAGLVLAREVAGWALAAGTTYEQRGTYTILDAPVLANRALTNVSPGQAVHLSGGVDGLVGPARLTLLVVGDLYGKDQVTVRNGGAVAVREEYQLGPSVTTSLRLGLPVPRFREFSLFASNWLRTQFKGPDGSSIANSGGNLLDVGFNGVLGQPSGIGVLVGADYRYFSGLGSDETIATAALGVAGGTLGLVVPAGRTSVQPFVRAQFGNINTGPTGSSALGFSAGVTLGVR